MDSGDLLTAVRSQVTEIMESGVNRSGLLLNIKRSASMSDSKNVMPVLVDLATKLAGEDQTNDWIKVIRGGPSQMRVYTPQQLGLNNVPLGAPVASNWIDISGYRTLVAYYRITGTYGGSSYGLDLLGSPVGAGDSWGSDTQWAVSLAMRSGLTATGNYVVGNTGVSNLSGASAWTGCIARKVRVDIGGAGAAAFGSAYLLCLP